jgi:hypothetical protein
MLTSVQLPQSDYTPPPHAASNPAFVEQRKSAPLDTTASAGHRVGRDPRVREERVAQLGADELDPSAALTRVPVGVELDLVLGAKPLRANGAYSGSRMRNDDGLPALGTSHEPSSGRGQGVGLILRRLRQSTLWSVAWRHT